jgi:branched-chain amino acid transport system substrate-binding protein
MVLGMQESRPSSEEDSVRRKSIVAAFLALFVGVLAFTAAGCGGDEDGGGDTGEAAQTGGGGGSAENLTSLPASSCRNIVYKGDGDAQYLIASDLPRQGGSRLQTTQMVQAIQYVLEQEGWKAGDKTIAYQDCDDSTAQAAKWDSGKCSQNANAYAQNEDLIAVIGTFNSGCAQIEVPVLNNAPGGGLLMVSPANTYGCLTEPCAGDEPEKYYPTGTRNYARVAPSDPNQGAVLTQFAKEQGIKSVYILNDKEAYGLGVATNFRGAAEAAGIKVLGFDAFEPRSANFEAVFNKIKGTNPDAVMIGGLVDENSGQVIDDKVAVLGPNDGDVKLLLPDGYATDAIFQRKEGGTPNAKGAFFTVAGAPVDKFTGRGGEFGKAFQEEKLKGAPVDPYAILASQAAYVVLRAIENSDGSRASVIEQAFQTKFSEDESLVGAFEINENGDVAAEGGAVVTFTVYEGTNKLKSLKTMEPDPELTEAARKEAAG